MLSVYIQVAQPTQKTSARRARNSRTLLWMIKAACLAIDHDRFARGSRFTRFEKCRENVDGKRHQAIGTRLKFVRIDNRLRRGPLAFRTGKNFWHGRYFSMRISMARHA